MPLLQSLTSPDYSRFPGEKKRMLWTSAPGLICLQEAVEMLGLLNNVALHWAEHTEQCFLLLFADLFAVKRLDQVFYEGVEISRSDAHTLVRFLHRFARILARAT